jgi:hypothetical protein
MDNLMIQAVVIKITKKKYAIAWLIVIGLERIYFILF